MATGNPGAVYYLTFEDIEFLGVTFAQELFGRMAPLPRLQMLGGEEGAGVLIGILELPRQTINGEPAYPTVFDKAAVLLRSVSADHPFVDGNKRMSLAISMLFLAVNGWWVEATDRELVDLAMAVATGDRRDLADLADRFQEHSIAI